MVVNHMLFANDTVYVCLVPTTRWSPTLSDICCDCGDKHEISFICN